MDNGSISQVGQINVLPFALNLDKMRRINSIRVLEAVREHGPISRVELSHRTRLSAPTVSAQVERLKERGLLIEMGRGKSRGGRRPVIIEFNAGYRFLVGADLGPSRIRLAMADLRGKVLGGRVEYTPSPPDADAVIRAVISGIREMIAENGLSVDDLFALGMGAPGITNVETGCVVNAVNLGGWRDVPLGPRLEEEFGVPVLVDNDVNMAALGEHWRGCARRESNFVFIALGTGIGAGIVLDGKLRRGGHWHAGEIGQMLLSMGDRLEAGEGPNRLESQVGAAAIARLASSVLSESPPGQEARSSLSTIDSLSRLFEEADKGNPEATAVTERVASYLGVAVANIAIVLDPELIVFSSGIEKAGQPLLKQLERVLSRNLPRPPRIRYSALGREAQLMGGLNSALQLANVRLYESVVAPEMSGAQALMPLGAPLEHEHSPRAVPRPTV